MSRGIELTKHEQKIVYEALLHHDGHSLMPEWDLKDRRALTLAMDKIRREIMPDEIKELMNV